MVDNNKRIEKLFSELSKAEELEDNAGKVLHGCECYVGSIKVKLYKRLLSLFKTDSRFMCPKCGKPIMIGTHPTYYEDIYPRARCVSKRCGFEDRGPGFLYEFDAAVDWYNRHKEKKGE